MYNFELSSDHVLKHCDINETIFKGIKPDSLTIMLMKMKMTWGIYESFMFSHQGKTEYQLQVQDWLISVEGKQLKSAMDQHASGAAAQLVISDGIPCHSSLNF